MDSPNSDNRRWRRYPADWAAKLTPAGGASVDVRVVDSGHGGLGLKSCPPLEIGQLIDVALADIGSFPCSVVWQEADRCGVAFIEFTQPTIEYEKMFLGGPFADDASFDLPPSEDQASNQLSEFSVSYDASQADLDTLSRSLEALSRDVKRCQELLARIAEGRMLRSGHVGNPTI